MKIEFMIEDSTIHLRFNGTNKHGKEVSAGYQTTSTGWRDLQELDEFILLFKNIINKKK